MAPVDERLTLERLRAWHRALFRATAPADAGRLRCKRADGSWEHVTFRVDLEPIDGWWGYSRASAPARGAHPAKIRCEVHRACHRFEVACRALDGEPGSVRQAV